MRIRSLLEIISIMICVVTLITLKENRQRQAIPFLKAGIKTTAAPLPFMLPLHS